MKRIKKYLIDNWIIIPILLVGLFLRIYKATDGFYFTHDMDLASWFIRDVLVNQHLRLIGQETSTHGIFIGPFYYYLLIPFYFLTNMEPTGSIILVTIIGLFGIWSFYYVFNNLFNKRAGVIASLIYSTSYYTVFNDREVVPTMPVIIWTVWFFYALDLLMRKRQKSAFLLLGLLTGLIWDLNMALVLLTPLIGIAIWLSKKKPKLKNVKPGLIIFLLTIVPLVLFELRHGFSQFKSLIISLTSNQHDIISGVDKFNRVLLLFSKNAHGLLWGSIGGFKYIYTTIFLLLVFILLTARHIIKKYHAILLGTWLLLFVVFFSLYSKVLSEYYLNGTIVVWIFIVTVAMDYLLSKVKLRLLGFIIMLLFLIINIQKCLDLSFDKSSYIYKMAVVGEIKTDAQNRNFPCVAVSYMTDPGYELGWRYLYVLQNMHVNKPPSGSPVYSIVYPLKEYYEVNKTIGAIGLIYPDYNTYDEQSIIASCQGENQNLTDPMPNFTN